MPCSPPLPIVDVEMKEEQDVKVYQKARECGAQLTISKQNLSSKCRDAFEV